MHIVIPPICTSFCCSCCLFTRIWLFWFAGFIQWDSCNSSHRPNDYFICTNPKNSIFFASRLLINIISKKTFIYYRFQPCCVTNQNWPNALSLSSWSPSEKLFVSKTLSIDGACGAPPPPLTILVHHEKKSDLFGQFIQIGAKPRTRASLKVLMNFPKIDPKKCQFQKNICTWQLSPLI